MNYIPLSGKNVDEAISLVRSVFPGEFETEDSPEEAYRASIDREHHRDFIDRHHLDVLQYFLVKNEEGKNIGVTGWYTENNDPKEPSGWDGIVLIKTREEKE